MEMYSYVEGTQASANEMLTFAGMPIPALPRETLPFTVKVVRTDAELRQAVSIRHAAYARHVPNFAEMLKQPEPYDREDGSLVLLAQSKLDGSALGTMRIQTNRHAPLQLEHSVTLPDWLQGRTLAEPSRLGVSEGGIGRVVKAALLKACFNLCRDSGIDWMIITARKPVDRQYEALLFEDVFPGSDPIAMAHVGNIPHRILAIEVDSAEAKWAAAGHPLFKFMCRTWHPDIETDVDDFSVQVPYARKGSKGFENRMAVPV